MLNKSIRPTKADIIGIQKIIENDMRVEKSPSEALFFAYKDAAEDIPDWNTIKKLKFNDDDSEVDDQSCGGTMSFTVDEKDFNIVVESLKQQLGIEKVRISYMTRLCILAARKRLVPAEREEKVVKVQNIDGVELLRRVNETAARLIQSGNIEKIVEFLER
ncbi:hypothetical protein GT568_03095 [Coprococcus sp. BIOML-A1]|uniref:hypothetical protein n=1 Tax=unclassified Coprococcus TaxID=2684943 RepID=UPI00136948E4|nr:MULTISPECIES: hypothetical protein [unclassified Coprococcus]MZK37841.1 hypothetical protein [Coprococcus sp. BIOML-A1]MZK62440.1 hypothetical protein [Coprococcus sp. BIOML-A2]